MKILITGATGLLGGHLLATEWLHAGGMQQQVTTVQASRSHPLLGAVKS